MSKYEKAMIRLTMIVVAIFAIGYLLFITTSFQEIGLIIITISLTLFMGLMTIELIAFLKA